MAIKRLLLNQFRGFQAEDLKLNKLNTVFFGANGSGKTSLLEAVYIAFTGGSHRTGTLNNCIAMGGEQFGVELVDAYGDSFKISKHQQKNKSWLVNGEAGKSARFAAIQPVKIIDHLLFQFFDGARIVRRKFIDWGAYHKHPEFGVFFNKYNKVLKQRNALLKSGRCQEAEILVWDELLIKYSLELTKLRRSWITGFWPIIKDNIQLLIDHEIINHDLSLEFDPGYNEKNFAQQLIDSRNIDLLKKTTTIGAHKADLKISIAGAGIKHVLSRGQTKMLICGIIYAQILSLTDNDRPCVLLVDDLGAELDHANFRYMIKLFLQLGLPMMVTTAVESSAVELAELCSAEVYEIKKTQQSFKIVPRGT
jgi:DNA replication and repair protein RecF